MSRNDKNTRRYPRVFLTQGVQDFEKIVGLEVEWPEGFVIGVLDISYLGAAIIKTSKVTSNYHKGDQVEFKFQFDELGQKVPVSCQVIRSDEKSIAVYFPELTITARQALEKFLKQKLIGLNMHLVDPKFYIKEQGFDYWFHGPNQTNIFIWGNSKEIQKANFEINYEVISFEGDRFFSSESKTFLDLPTEDYAYRVNNPDSKTAVTKKDKVVNDILSLLSQIQDKTGVIQKLAQEIKKS